MSKILKIVNNRNFLLITSLIVALFFPKISIVLKNYVLYILAIVMLFSSTSFDLSYLKDHKNTTKIILIAFLLNYIIFGLILLATAKLCIKDFNIWLGFVVISATPAGVAIIPFTFLYKGDTNYSLTGVLGIYLLSIIFTPLIIEVFAQDTYINIWNIFKIMIKILIIPLVISQIFKREKILKYVQPIRGKIINWGFAIIIYTIIGLNRQAIFSNFITTLKISIVLFITIFLSGIVYEIFFRKKIIYGKRVSQNLMLTIKSSGFSAATALSLFGEKAALPSAIMAVFVILYLITTGFIYNKK